MVDFGDILDQWEKSNKKKTPGEKTPPKEKKAPGNDPQREDPVSSKKVDPMTAWIRRYGVEDKDAIEEEEKVSAARRRQRLLHKKPDMTIDLHGLSRDEAWTALEAFFRDARRRGFEKVLIIHGKGNHSAGDAVLKRTVREFIERCPGAGESGHSSASGGGAGATWVLLKNRNF